ncbi:MAG TPA: (d)CMP kinase [Flavobacterium sp.]|nr:(d)CMP kinase [Flavobacterium sp.]
MKKITIAIDGYSSTGKSTLAKQIAKTLNYVYVDTGAMYRAVTLFAIEHNIIDEQGFDIQQLINELPNITLTFHFNTDLGFAEMYLNNINVEQEIRSMRVSRFVSQVAAVSAVRTKLVQQQKLYGRDKGVVMDGRDIGTVVFPDAELKIFMTASTEIRAQRRFLELQDKGQAASYEDVFKNVQDRDAIDTTREDSPLKQADDAVVIDNSVLSREEQFNMILNLVKQRINN